MLCEIAAYSPVVNSIFYSWHLRSGAEFVISGSVRIRELVPWDECKGVIDCRQSGH